MGRWFELRVKGLSKKWLISILVLFLSLTISFGGIPREVRSEKKTDSSVKVASVNGEEITKEELVQRARIYHVFVVLGQVPKFARFLMTTEAGQEALDRYRAYVLEKLIEERLQFQKAKELGIAVAEEEIEKKIDSILKHNEKIEDKSDLAAKLESDYRSMEELRREIESNLLQDKLKERVTKDVQVKKQEMINYYEKNKDSFKDKEGNLKPFQEVKAKIREDLKKKKKRGAWKDWLGMVKERADIERTLQGVDFGSGS